MARSVDEVLDLVKGTLGTLDKHKVTDLTSDLQKYVALPKLLKNASEDTGDQIDVNALTDDNGQARFIGLNENDVYAERDALVQGNVPWRFANTNYCFDRYAKKINEGAREVVNFVKLKRYQGLISLYKLVETAFWSKPATSADVRTIWGIGNYVVKNATEGFTGGNATGFSTGNIFDSTTVTRWKNWAAQNVAWTPDDGIAKVLLAMLKTEFEGPIDMDEVRTGAVRRGLYTTSSVYQTLAIQTRNQNNQLGGDLGTYAGKVIVNRVPVQWVPQLDGDTQNPLYGIDWDTLYPVNLKGEHMREAAPRIHPDQHNSVVVDIDTAFNIVCVDRRRQFVVATA